jgi:hypothetical protein
MIVDTLKRAKLLTIRRIRRLPVPGHVLVNEGDSVHPEDVIAEAWLPGEVFILDIAKCLGIESEETGECLVRQIGETVQQDDIIAQCEGALPRLVRSPVEGKLVEYYQGKVVLATGQTVVNIRAGMIASIVEVIPELGAVLSVTGSLLQGLWGNGRVGSGILKVIEPAMERPLEISDLDSLESGLLVMAGMCSSVDVLRDLEGKKAAGLIVRTLLPELIPEVVDLHFPVLVLQGFSDLQPDPISAEILLSLDGEIACINACQRDVFTGQHPELIIPQGKGNPEEEKSFKEKLDIGQQVILLSGSDTGKIGEVTGLYDEKMQFESGLILEAAEIRLQNDELIHVPSQNLLILD